jgi:glycosyltransferase involved in cell wall biosynthesis
MVQKENRLTEPKLTVVVPIFNRSGEVDRLIANLLSQDIADAEFLLLDDGSTDDTAQRIKHRLHDDSRLKLITKQNTGTGDTRNVGIREAKGEWLFFLDSDDAIPSPKTLSRLVNIAEAEHVQIAGGSIQFVKRGQILSPITGWPRPETHVPETLINAIGDLTREPFECFFMDGVYSYADYQYDAGFSRFIYSKKLLIDNDIRFPRMTFYEDPLFFVRAMDAASCFAAVTEPSYVYRLGSHIGRFDAEYCKENLQGFRSNLQFSRRKKYPLLHKITYERFKKFDIVELALNHENYDDIAGLVEAAFDAFDPDFAGVNSASELPASVAAINSFGTPEWDSGLARLKRYSRLESIKIKNRIKQSSLFKGIENLKV